jgi:hypothetical protein
LRPVCFNDTGKEHHVFVIGDWGGIQWKEHDPPKPADHRDPKFGTNSRPYIYGVDDQAQQLVAEQMKIRASTAEPDYIINVGDNFYWAGIDKVKCGAPPFRQQWAAQWWEVFEAVYHGHGIDGKQWLGVLGNHDYGGYTFTSAWDQVIAYTWNTDNTGNRWMTPAQYWSSKVHYPDFSVDYYFLDSNVWDTGPIENDPEHNMCGLLHNTAHASCGPQGPTSTYDCPQWFARLWLKQQEWLETHLSSATSDWQIVVTHFPPSWGINGWTYLAQEYGIDLIITGHIHQQSVFDHEDPNNPIRPTAFIISGGGGGITSEATPTVGGDDDEYGFMDITLRKKEIQIDAISHQGMLRKTAKVPPRTPGQKSTVSAPAPTSASSLGPDASADTADLVRHPSLGPQPSDGSRPAWRRMSPGVLDEERTAARRLLREWSAKRVIKEYYE